jgi:lysine 6-dehydrogenase
MTFRYAILGAGRQGTASAYDLGRFGDASEIHLYDRDAAAAQQASEKVNALLGHPLTVGRALDVRDSPALKKALSGIHSTISAVPYIHNYKITLAAISAGSNLCDLGGHTDTVRKQLALGDPAKKTGITITPDCGMGPGININMGVRAMAYIQEPEDVFIWDGGLPQNPQPPWNYASTFHINGLTNEYFGDAWFIREGLPTPVACLTEVESLDFPQPLGRLEAAVTSGGLSTAPWTLAGRLKRLENKTLRYPGHWEQFRAFQKLGLFETDPVKVGNHSLVPREFFHALLEPKIRMEEVRDICVIRTECKGQTEGLLSTCTLELIETYDEQTGFTAMEKLTGWHASMIAILGAKGKLPRGAVSVENVLTGKLFDEEIQRRGWNIRKKVKKTAR